MDRLLTQEDARNAPDAVGAAMVASLLALCACEGSEMEAVAAAAYAKAEARFAEMTVRAPGAATEVRG